MSTLEIGQAMPADRDALQRLQEVSFREIGGAYYDAEVINAYIAHIGTLDDVLIEDGTYYVVRIDGDLVGCGGWSMRAPNYEAHVAGERAAPARPVPTVRSVYVHPAYARRGIARALMRHIEATIARAGFDRAVLGATLAGIPLYLRMGYRSIRPMVVRLPHELLFITIEMEKRFGRVDGFVSAA